MKITAKKKEGLSQEYNVVVPSDKVQVHIDKRLAEYGKSAKIPGFRPGKVPANILQQRYGDAARAEALERVINAGVSEVIREQKITPAMQPKVDVVRYEEKTNEVEFNMTIEVLPEITVADLSKIKVEKPVKIVDDKEINEALARITESNKNSEPVEEKRAAKKGDVLRIDFDGSVDGVKKPGMKGDDYDLELGSNSFIDNFEDQLVGKKVGDHVTVSVTFPKEYGAKDLAGKAAVFEVDVKELRKSVKPEINDAFAATVGFKDLAELKENVKKQILREYEQFTRMKVKRALLDALDSANKFDVPAGMCDEEYKQIWDQHLNDLKHRGIDASEAEKDKETQKEFRVIAERRVRLGLVLSEIGRLNKIEVTREELSRAIMREAGRYPGQQDQVFNFYKKNPQAVDMLRAPIYEEKVVDYILTQASVTEKEVDLDTLLSDPDDEKEEKRTSKTAKKEKADDAGEEKASKAKKK